MEGFPSINNELDKLSHIMDRYNELQDEILACKSRMLQLETELKSLPIRRREYELVGEPLWIPIPTYRIYHQRIFRKSEVQHMYRYQDSWQCRWVDDTVTTESFNDYDKDSRYQPEYKCPDGIVEILVTPVMKRELFEIDPHASTTYDTETLLKLVNQTMDEMNQEKS